MNTLEDLTLAEAADLVASQKVTPVELTEACLARIEEVNDDLRAYIGVYADEALDTARAASRAIADGDQLGPLHGIPVAIKDNIAWAGRPISAGSRILRDWVPSEDATVVSRLKQSGAILLGTTNMHEFAWGGTSENPHYGAVKNPWNKARTPAGSSGGSGAAVAARTCFASLGTDTGGSIRLPAAVNGLAGLRPSIGRVSNAGVVPLAWSLDAVGPLTRTVEDCALVFASLVGHDPKDPGSVDAPIDDCLRALHSGIAGLRIGLVRDYALENVQTEIAGLTRNAIAVLESLGATVHEIPIPGIERAWSSLMTIHTVEPSAFHQQWLREHPEEYGADVRANLQAGELIPATDYVQAQRLRRLLRAEFLTAFESVDLFLSPTIPYAATEVGATSVEIRPGEPEPLVPAIVQFTGIAPVTGLPALSVPCGFDSHGVPVGMQLLGRPFDEKTLLQAGTAFQGATDFHVRKPPAAQSL